MNFLLHMQVFAQIFSFWRTFFIKRFFNRVCFFRLRLRAQKDRFFLMPVHSSVSKKHTSGCIGKKPNTRKTNLSGDTGNPFLSLIQ